MPWADYRAFIVTDAGVLCACGECWSKNVHCRERKIRFQPPFPQVKSLWGGNCRIRIGGGSDWWYGKEGAPGVGQAVTRELADTDSCIAVFSCVLVMCRTGTHRKDFSRARTNCACVSGNNILKQPFHFSCTDSLAEQPIRVISLSDCRERPNKACHGRRCGTHLIEFGRQGTLRRPTNENGRFRPGVSGPLERVVRS